MKADDFNQAVIDQLNVRGKPAVAHMCEELDGSMDGLSSATVAKTLGVGINPTSVTDVADAREEWYEEHYHIPRVGFNPQNE